MNAILPTIKLGSLEGPFDLILELVRKKNLDLSDISLKQVTNDFLKYLKSNSLAPEIMGSFLIVASTLVLLKARQLLPDAIDEEEDEISELSERLAIYNVYRKHAEHMQNVWSKHRLYPSQSLLETRPIQTRAIFPENITTHDVHQLFSYFIATLPKLNRPKCLAATKGLSLKECFSLLTQRLRQVKHLVFQEVVQNSSRQDTATSFLAILEMARSRIVELHQEHSFERITISRNTL